MAAFLRFAKSSPFVFGMGYSCMKTSFCDLMVQKVVEKRETIDWRRNLAFGSFGLFYLGGVQYFLYVPVFSRIFPQAGSFAAKSIAEKIKDLPGIRNVFSQVFLDQFVHHPLLYFPVFYMTKDFVTNDKPDPLGCIEEYKKNMAEDLTALWKLWVPSTLLNFAFMPMWARIPWVATTSLVWTCILSAMRGSQDMPAGEVLGPSIDSRQMEIFQRSLVGPAPTLDPSRGHLLMTLHGPDKKGIIASLSKVVHDAGGSITTSKMIRLGNEFAIVLHADCRREDLPALFEAIGAEQGAKHWADGCDLTVREVNTSSLPTASPPAFTAEVRLTGEDKPGLLMRLSEVLKQHGLNIEHLQTEQHLPGSPSKPQLFTLHGFVTASKLPDLQALSKAMGKLEEELDVMCSVVSDSVSGQPARQPRLKESRTMRLQLTQSGRELPK